MGTDYLELFDRGTAELIMHASEGDLATFVESRTRPLQGPPVWREYYDSQRESTVEFAKSTSALERLKTLLSYQAIDEVKTELILLQCKSDWLYLDYWGCTAGLYSPEDPPGSTTWEQFLAPMFGGEYPKPEPMLDEDGAVLFYETSGSFLLTSSNTEAMILSLKAHRNELQVMRETEIDKLVRWHEFCLRHKHFCVLYQVDF